MIEQGLFFATGVCVSALIWVLLLPAFWRRALRISRARLALSLPLSLEEVLAEQDRLRAAHAVALAQADQRVASQTLTISSAKAEASASRAERMVFEARCAEYQARAEALEIEHRQMLDVIEAQRESITTLMTMMVMLRAVAAQPAPNPVSARSTSSNPAPATPSTANAAAVDPPLSPTGAVPEPDKATNLRLPKANTPEMLYGADGDEGEIPNAFTLQERNKTGRVRLL
jgi:hypothetical protein